MTEPEKTITDIFLITDEQSLKDQLLFDQLSAKINDMINNDFEKLISLLYRIDVSEKKLRQLLNENRTEDAGNIIATLIINRQLEKIRLRKKSSPGQNKIPDDEKW